MTAAGLPPYLPSDGAGDLRREEMGVGGTSLGTAVATRALGSTASAGSGHAAGVTGSATSNGAAGHPEATLDRIRLAILALQREGARALATGLRSVNLTASQAEILAVVGQHGPLTLKALGDLIVCELGSPSRAVDLLVKRGLLDRRTNPADRRYVEIGLTREGWAALPTIDAAARDLTAQMRAALSPAEAEVLAGLLTRLLGTTPAAAAIETRCGPAGPAPEGA